LKFVLSIVLKLIELGFLNFNRLVR
jgi:hypothetical protein